MRRRWRTCSMVAVVAVAASLAGCGDEPTLAATKDADESATRTLREQIEDLRGVSATLEVPVVRLTTGTICSELSITGELVPKESVIVRPLMDGRITFLVPLAVGDRVAEDDEVAKIDDRDIEDEIAQQERQIEITNETLELDTNELAQKEKDLVFDRDLVSEGFLNENELKRSELNLNRAEIALRQSRLRLEQEESRLQKVMRQREKVLIVAPISGMVVRASHLLGGERTSGLLNEEVTALDGRQVGTGTNLFGIVSHGDYVAQCLVNGKDKAKLKVGQKVRLTVISHRAISTTGEVMDIAHLQEPTTHAYKVWIRPEKMAESFTSGLFVRANIELGRSEGAIVVSKDYVKERDNRDFVQIVVDNAVCDKWVTTGLKQGNLIEIEEGVAPGDVLIASDEVIAVDRPVMAIEKEKTEP